MPAVAAEDGERIPGGGLEQHVGGAVADLGGGAAHDAGEGDHSGVVGDDDVLGIEVALDTVEGGELLPCPGAPHDQLTLQGGGVEGVQRLTEFEHDVVGHVDRGRDRADTGGVQAALHPPRGDGLRVDAGDARAANRVAFVSGSSRIG